jgi:hypothetical protein
MQPTPLRDSFYAICGTAAPLVAVVTSYQEQVEYSMRIASMVLGMLASAIYIISLIRKMK